MYASLPIHLSATCGIPGPATEPTRVEGSFATPDTTALAAPIPELSAGSLLMRTPSRSSHGHLLLPATVLWTPHLCSCASLFSQE